jgi:CRP-like cAMP-binding protein
VHLITRLSHFARLSERDMHALAQLTTLKRNFRSATDLVSEGDAPIGLIVVLDGMLCRYRITSDGRRQILTFVLPGDFCGIHNSLVQRMDHGIATIGPSSISITARERVVHILRESPWINEVLWWSNLQELSVEREHLVSLGRRNAHARVACLLCELVWRLEAVGLCEGDEVRLPMTQTDLADALGLTPIHVNRVLHDFRNKRLIAMNRSRLRLLDFEKLVQIADVSRNYLHLDGNHQLIPSVGPVVNSAIV